MDLIEAMNLWTTECEGTLAGWQTEEGYYTLFIKTGKVRGHTKATAGGIRWEWPDELLSAEKEQKEWKEEKKRRLQAVEDAMVRSSQTSSIERRFNEQQIEEDHAMEEHWGEDM